MADYCTFCSTDYVAGRDPDGNYWRTLCKCEIETRCFKGPHYATHARNLAGRAVFACDKHGVSYDDRSEVAILPPPPLRGRQALATKVEPTPPVEKAAPKPRVVTKAPALKITVDLLTEVYSKDTWEVICRCGSQHAYGVRKWTAGEKIETNSTSGFGSGFTPFTSHCPACDAPDRDPDSYLPTWKEATPSPPPTTAKKRVR